MNLFTTLGVGLAPLLLSTQAQATSVAVPITRVQPAEFTSAARGRGMTPEDVLRLNGEISPLLSQLLDFNRDLEEGIDVLHTAIGKGERVEISQSLVNSADSSIESAKASMALAQEAFGYVLSVERIACRPMLEELQTKTIAGIAASIETMKKIPELSKQASEQTKAVVAFEQDRMSVALNSDRIEMKPGMSREEKRRFILSHAS